MPGDVIHVPLVHGAQEGIDAKLLPQGWLTRAENVRFRKDGRLGSRYGYDFVSGSQGQAIGSASFDASHSVYVKDRVDAATPAKWYARDPDGTYSTPVASTAVGAVGVPRRISIARNVRSACMASDCAYAGKYIFLVHWDGPNVAQQTGSASLTVTILDAQSLRVASSYAIGVAPTNPRIVVAGTTVLVFYSDNSTFVKAHIINASTLATSTVTVVTPTFGRYFSFDVAPLNGTSCLLAYEQAAANIRWGTVDTAGAFSSVQDTAIANPARIGVVLGATSGNVVLAWAEGASFNDGTMKYRVSTLVGGTIVAATTIGSNANGYPLVGPAAANDFAIAWQRSTSGLVMDVFLGGSVYSTQYLQGVSKPFVGPGSATLMWCVNGTQSVDEFSTYAVLDLASLPALNLTTGPICEATACQYDAQPGLHFTSAWTSQFQIENRRSCVSVPTVLSAPGATAVAAFLPVRVAQTFGGDLVRIDSGVYADRLLPAKLNGTVLFSGPRVRQYDGRRFFESGFYEPPRLSIAAVAGAGSLAAGTRQYVGAWEWTDGAGCLHRSPPSDPVEVTTTAASRVDISGTSMPFDSRADVVLRIYRTKDDEEIFYLISKNALLGAGAVFLLSDEESDDVIAIHEILYTQGERGGLSGLLANDAPPPARFIWAGNSRVILGGLEDASSVRWSKLVFPGEPVQFANQDAFIGRIDSEVLGVASLDGVWFVGSRESIWAFTGSGPEDNGANGSFGEPTRLPADVGFYSQRSIVEVPQGLLFQAAADRIYLLPRGAGAPVWIGQQVRDTLALYPFIADAQLIPDENVVVFVCLNAAATDGVLLIYDTRIGEWTVDVPFGGAAASSRVFRCANLHGGKLMLDGQIAETSLFADDETGAQNRAIAETVATGDVTPFGPMGNGRVRGCDWLGEFRSAATVTLEVSYDSGQSYDAHIGSWVTSGSAGDRLEREYRLKYVRTKSPRFRLTSTPTTPGEGTVFNDLSLEVFPEKGMPRLAASQRA